MKGMTFFFTLLLLFSGSQLHSQSGLRIEPDEIVLEEGAESPLFNGGAEIHIINQDSRAIDMTIIASSPAIKIYPPSYRYSCTEDITFLITYEGEIPEPENMFFSLVIMNKTDRITNNFLIYHPLAYSPPLTGDEQLNPDEYDIILTYYYSPTCKSCREFLEKEIPRLEEKLNIKIGMELRDVFDQNNMDLMHNRLKEAGVETNALPLLDTGSEILAGESKITGELEKALKGEAVTKEEKQNKSSPSSQAPLWLMVAGAGLLDGINPCAFSTLIFLLAYLGLRKRSRREIRGVGIVFSLTVFVTYTAVGGGAFLLLRESMSFGWISLALKWGGATLLLLLALISLKDYFKIRRGDSSDMTLQLSPAIKRAVHKSVRGGVRSALPLAGACGMGFLVTIYELGCTGQIYLPTLYLMIRRGERVGLALLLLYNLVFIIPLVVVFILAYRGLNSERLGQWFTKRLGAVKLLTALFFLVAAAAILIF
jgi:hypothetical protein